MTRTKVMDATFKNEHPYYHSDDWPGREHAPSGPIKNQQGGCMRQGYEGGSRTRDKKVEIKVMWVNGEMDSFLCKEPQTIQQHYKQLNFIEHTGEAVAINLHQTKYVKIDDVDIDFNQIAQT